MEALVQRIKRFRKNAVKMIEAAVQLGAITKESEEMQIEALKEHRG